MSYVDKRFQVGNYAKDWTEKILRIVEIKEGGVTAQYANEERRDVPWQDIIPLPIREDLLDQIGFKTIKERLNPYHREVTVSSIINGRHYHMMGFLYEDKSLWTFNGMSLRYLHQVQNILYILEPTIDHQVRCSSL